MDCLTMVLDVSKTNVDEVVQLEQNLVVAYWLPEDVVNCFL